MSDTDWNASPFQPSVATATVSVVVMTYNEAETLEATVREIAAELDGIGCGHEIVVVDDGSTDGSAAIADKLTVSVPRLRVVHHKSNKGLGGVYRTGFSEARSDLLSFFPADGQFPAAILPEFYAAMTSADLVLGYLPDRRGAWVGRALSMIERGIYNAMFNGFPRFQGVFMCRTALLRCLSLRSSGRGWAVVMEFILRAKRAEWRLVSRPTVIRPRVAGRSKVNNFRTIAANTRQMLALRSLMRDSPSLLTTRDASTDAP